MAPRYKSIKVSKDTVFVQFSHSPMGITTFGKALTQFQVAGDDKVFYKASAEIKGSVIVFLSNQVKSPVAVRYAFSDWAYGELYGTEGLPVPPFRSDEW